jgi:DNA-binding CsgD family transcriptional regulator
MAYIYGKLNDTRLSSFDLSHLGSLLSKNEALVLLELMHKSLSCIGEDDFFDLFSIVQNLLPSDFACALLGYCNNEDIFLVDGINISYPDEFCWEYILRDRYQKDTVVRESFTTCGLQCWCADKNRQHLPEELLSLANDFGMQGGYAMGSRPFGAGKYGSVFVFAHTTAVNPDARTRAILDAIAPHLHLALSRACSIKRSSSNGIVLSTREKEVLDWVKQGKSSWDISVILGISERTVNFHISNIMQKLGTINRAQAVAVAAHLGFIDYE